MLQIRFGDASLFTRSAAVPDRTLTTTTTQAPAPDNAVFLVDTAKAPTVDRVTGGYDTGTQPSPGVVVAPPPPDPTLYDAAGFPIATPTTTDASAPKGSTTMPTPTATKTTEGYSCSDLSCRGAGLYDLQFRQLQDLLNQAAAKLGFAQITVNGIIDVSNTMPLYAAISNTGAVPGITMPVDVPYNPQWIVDNVSGLIWALGAWLQTPAWKQTLVTSVAPNVAVRSDVVPPASGAGPQVMYVCPDGVTKVTDPSMCPMVSPPASGGGEAYPPANGGGIVVTAPDGSTTVMPLAPAWQTTARKVARSPITIGVLGILGGIFLGSLVLRNS
jgi:hypothetical protein